MELSSKPQRRPEIAWRVIEGEAVVVNPRSGSVFPLNPVATRLWELAEGKNTVEQMIAVIAEEFDAPTDVLAKDAQTFFEDLSSKAMIDVT